ncbi:hypothetical protein EBME_1250 [bacterium endosymbiont of Mortierella elongata FMR23-6]|nr:hypothetical protein EBME_1250 [bacterium endosymbiont of Mortierella elongata FMR23-6]
MQHLVVEDFAVFNRALQGFLWGNTHDQLVRCSAFQKIF